MTTITSFERGPYLSAALLCEKVLEEKDGVKSAIRIIDRLNRTAVGPSPPENMEPFDYEVTLLIRLKSGWARGPYTLRVVLVKPSGESPPPVQQTVHLEGEEDRGVDVVANIRMRLDLTGIYWFEIYLSNGLLTKIPFRVVYTPQVSQMRGPGAGSPPAQGAPPGS